MLNKGLLAAHESGENMRENRLQGVRHRGATTILHHPSIMRTNSRPGSVNGAVDDHDGDEDDECALKQATKGQRQFFDPRNVISTAHSEATPTPPYPTLPHSHPPS